MNDDHTPTTELQLHKLIPNPNQPRQTFDPDKLKSLARSIDQNGIIQPVTVEEDQTNGHYIIHDGERRWRASCALSIAWGNGPDDEKNKTDVALQNAIDEVCNLDPLEMVARYRDTIEWAVDLPVAVVAQNGKQTSSRNLRIRAVVANLQRDDLNAIELAESYQALKDEDGMTDEQIAQAVGKSRTSITNVRRLLKLPAGERGKLSSGEISPRQALALLPLYDYPVKFQERIRDNWQAKSKIAKPESHTADQLRKSIQDAAVYEATQIKYLPVDFEFTGEQFKHAACVNCPLHFERGHKNSKKYYCTDDNCYRAKLAEWSSAALAVAAEKASLPVVEDDDNTGYDQRDSFVDNDENKLTIAHALETKCPNLKLTHSHWVHRNFLRPNGCSDQIYYLCHHSGKKCQCLALQRAEATEAEKARKIQLRKIKKGALAHVRAVVSDVDPLILRAFLYATYDNWNGQRTKILAMNDHVLLEKTVAKITNTLEFNAYTKISEYEIDVAEWLEKLGFDESAQYTPELAELENKLERVCSWVDNLFHQPITDDTEGMMQAIRGNIINLNEIMERLDEIIESEPDQVTIDKCERLHARREQATDRLTETREALHNVSAQTTEA